MLSLDQNLVYNGNSPLTRDLDCRSIKQRLIFFTFFKRAPVVAGTSSIRRTLCNSAQAACIAKVLSASQKYMREEKVKNDSFMPSSVLSC